MKNKIALLVAAASLSACAVGPDFLRPDAPDTTGYTTGPMQDTTNSVDDPAGTAQHLTVGADVDGHWWTRFNNETLDDYVAEALKNNPSLAQAQASLRQARETVYAAEGAYYPSIDGNANVTRSKNSAAEFGEGGGATAIPFNLLYTIYTANVSASYTADIWGGIRRSVESEEAQQEYQLYETEAAYQSLTGNVVSAAITEASLRAQIASTENIIKLESEALRIINAQFELGGVSKADVLSQQTNLAQQKALLPPLHKQLAETRDELMALMGRFPDQDDGRPIKLAELTLPADLPVSVPSDLVNQRPDIRAAEAALHAATANVGVSTANLLPQVQLTASYGVEATTTNSLFGPGSQIYSLGAGVTQPLFHGGTLWHERRESQAALDAAVAAYKGTVINAFQNVADALRVVEADADALKAEVEAERSAEESYKIAKMQFDAGSLTYLTLLTTEQQYQQTTIALAQAEAQRYTDTAALYQALGGGWWNRTDIPNEDEADYRARVEGDKP
jgi:NodT family efflux transporter outer membrane factor (OMF) lipoprotein